MKLALVGKERREAEPGLDGLCSVCGAGLIAKCGHLSGTGRIAQSVPAIDGGSRKQNGTAIGKISFHSIGRN